MYEIKKKNEENSSVPSDAGESERNNASTVRSYENKGSKGFPVLRSYTGYSTRDEDGGPKIVSPC